MTIEEFARAAIDKMDKLHDQLAVLKEENERLKEALKEAYGTLERAVSPADETPLEPPLLPMLPEDWDIKECGGTFHLYYREVAVARLATAHETVVSLNWARNVLHHLKNLSMEGYPNVDHDIDYLQSILDKRNTQC